MIGKIFDVGEMSAIIIFMAWWELVETLSISQTQLHIDFVEKYSLKQDGDQGDLFRNRAWVFWWLCTFLYKLAFDISPKDWSTAYVLEQTNYLCDQRIDGNFAINELTATYSRSNVDSRKLNNILHSNLKNIHMSIS